MKRTSLTDIAEKLDVSVTLVSMALNGKAKENRISDEMVEKVLETAEELNYRPNQLARGLRTGHSKTIGLIVADISNPYFAQIGRKIEDEAERNGYHVIFCSSDEDAKVSRILIDLLNERQVDGLIIAPAAGSEEQIRELQESDIPLVLIDRRFPAIKTNYVITNNYDISFKLVSLLLEEGYRRIGTMFYNLELPHMQRRLKGYKAAFREKGLPFDQEWIGEVGFENLQEDIRGEFQRLLSPDINCDAFFFPTGELAVKTFKSSLGQDRKPSGNVGVGCFDDPDLFYFSSFPTLSVAQPLEEIGAKAVDIILGEIENEKTNGKEKLYEITLPSHFVRRDKALEKE
jgi:LacI family transcriptional regulator